MALKFFWRCEGTTLDGTDDFTAGDNAATLNSTAAINPDAAIYGTNGLDCPTNQDYALFTVSSDDLIGTTLGAVGFSFRIVTFVNNSGLFRADNSASANNHILVAMSGTDDATGRELIFTISRAGGSVSLTTTDADLALNTVYFCVARWDHAANDRRLEVYNSDGSLRTSIENLATSWTSPSGINQMYIGPPGTAGDVHIDNVFIGDSYSEPIEDNYDITSYTQYGATLDPIRLVWRQ